MDVVPGWTLEELTRRVALALAAAGPPVSIPGDCRDGRAREAPDQRAIRWYVSIGVMDRPIGGRGRGARYGDRHLRQLVAIRRLQAQGLTLAAIQGRLAGADDETLQILAPVPEAVLGSLPLPDGAAQRYDTRFWSPAEAPRVEVGVPGHATHGATGVAAVTAVPPLQVLGGLRLTEEVFLVLPRQPSATDLPVLAEAAAPLLAALNLLGLLPDPTPGVPR
jgi:DNA-binding transcriptional MerR regulator